MDKSNSSQNSKTQVGFFKKFRIHNLIVENLQKFCLQSESNDTGNTVSRGSVSIRKFQQNIEESVKILFIRF